MDLEEDQQDFEDEMLLVMVLFAEEGWMDKTVDQVDEFQIGLKVDKLLFLEDFLS